MQNPPIRLQALIDEPSTAQIDKNFAKQGGAGARAFTRGFNSQIKGLTDQARQELERLQRIAKRAFQTFGGSLDRGMRRVENAGFNALFGRLPPGIYQSHAFNASVQRRLNQLAQQQNLPGTPVGGFGRMPPAPIMAARARGRTTINPIRPFVQGAMGAMGTLYTIERFGWMLGRLTGVVGDTVKTLIGYNEDAQRFRIMASTSAGGLGRARELDIELGKLNRGLPTDRASTREAAGMYFSIPGLAGQTALSSPQQIALNAAQMAETQSRLKLLDPTNSDPRSAMLGMRELVEGDYRSIQRRFGLSREAIARAAGVDPSDISRDPQAALRGVQNLTSILVDKRSIDALNNLPSQIGEHIRQSVRDFVVRIGDQGSFKSVQSRLGNLRNSVYSYLDSPQSTEQAKRMSADVERILDNLTRAGTRFVHSLAGNKDGANSAESVASSAADIFEQVAKLSDVLPSMAEKIAEVTRITGVWLSDLIDQTERMRANMSVRGAVGSLVEDWRLRLHPSDARSKELSVMSETLSRISPNLKFGIEKRHDITSMGESYEPLPVMSANPKLAIIQNQMVNALDEMRATKRFNEPYNTSLHSRRAVEAQLDSLMPGWRDRLERINSEKTVNTPAGASRVPEALKAFIGSEEIGPNYQAIAQAVAARADIEGKRGSLRDLSDRRAALFGTNFGSESDPVKLNALYQRMSAMQSEFESKALPAIQAGQLFGSITDDPETRKLTDAAIDILEKSRARFRVAAESLDGILVGAARDFGEELQQSVGDAPARARSIVLDSVASGMTSLGQDVRSLLERAGRSVGGSDIGLESFAPELQNEIMRARVRAAAESGFEIGDLGELNLGQNSEAVKRAWANRNQSHQFAAAESLRRLKKLEPEQSALVDRNLAAFNADQSEANLVALAQSQADLSKLLSTMRQLRIESDLTLAGMLEFSAQVRDSLSSNLADGLADVVMGVGDLSDAFKNLASDIVRSFMRIQVQTLMFGLLGDFGTRNRDGTVNTSLGGLAGMFASIFSGSMNSGSSTGNSGWTVSSAKGNIFPGGLPFERFSKGGTIGTTGTKPSALFIAGDNLTGSRAAPEAILPLQRGRGGMLGVSAQGIQQQSVAPVVIVVNDADAAARAAARAELQSPGAQVAIVSAWTGDFVRGGQSFRAMKSKTR